MAYLRKEKEIVEIDFPIAVVWISITKAIDSLQWAVIEISETTHQLKIRTKKNFMAYSSLLNIEAKSTSEKVTRVIVSAETPVTTITGIVDFGRTRERIDSFFLELIKQVKARTNSKENNENSSLPDTDNTSKQK